MSSKLSQTSGLRPRYVQQTLFVWCISPCMMGSPTLMPFISSSFWCHKALSESTVSSNRLMTHIPIFDRLLSSSNVFDWSTGSTPIANKWGFPGAREKVRCDFALDIAPKSFGCLLISHLPFSLGSHMTSESFIPSFHFRLPRTYGLGEATSLR